MTESEMVVFRRVVWVEAAVEGAALQCVCLETLFRAVETEYVQGVELRRAESTKVAHGVPICVRG